MALELGSAADHLSVVSITLFTALLCVCVVIGHLLEERRWTNESITALAIGLLTGGVILWTTQGTSSRLLVFREDLFFTYWLPPIIFNAGFQVKKKQFFWNFSTIVLFGALGTLISFIIISVGMFSTFLFAVNLCAYFNSSPEETEVVAPSGKNNVIVLSKEKKMGKRLKV